MNNRHVWEGWTVQDFINELEWLFDMIMSGKSRVKPFNNDKELKKWLMDNQPGYKKHIPEVFEYFRNKMYIPEDFGLPKFGTKEFNDLASDLFGGKPRNEIKR